MEFTNTFIGKMERPGEAELAAALGAAAPIWTEFVEWMAKETGVVDQEWKGIYVNKYGWSLRLKRKGKNVVYLGPGEGCFLVSFVLSDRAVKSARESHLSRAVMKMLDEAPRYPEGTGLRFLVRRASELSAIRKIVAIKLATS